MATLGNILWFVLGGFVAGLSWWLAACVMHLTVIGIPFGVACWRIGRFAFFPFGKELVDAKMMGEKVIPGTALARLVWVLCGGIWVALAHGISALLCLASCIFVVPALLGAPFWAVAHARLASAALDPLGKRVVSKADANAIRAAYWSSRVRR